MSDNITIKELLREIQAENRDDHKDIKDRLDAFNGRLRSVEVQSASVEGLGGRVQQVEIDIAQIKERQKWYIGIPTALTVIGSSIAAILGMKH